MCTGEDDTHSAIGSVDMYIPEKIGRSLSLLSARSSALGGSVLEPWSPATTVRSTPPLDVEQGSPQTRAAVTVDSNRGARIRTASDASSTDGMTAPVGSGVFQNGFGAQKMTTPLEKALSFLAWARGWGGNEDTRVMPMATAVEQANYRSMSLGNATTFMRDYGPRVAPTSTGSVSSTRAVIHTDTPFEVTDVQVRRVPWNQAARSPVDESIGGDSKRLPSYKEATAHLNEGNPRTLQNPPLFKDTSYHVDLNRPHFYQEEKAEVNEDTPSHLRTTPLFKDATCHVEDSDVEMKRIRDAGDAEEFGLAPVTTILAEVKSHDAVMGSSRGIEKAVSVAAEPGLVLPCAPSDEEKILYYTTGRFVMVACGFVAFVWISAGMWMFTISSPYFYWFGVPTLFVLVYMLCHYFGVSLWGKDFDPDEHAEVIKKAAEQQYLPTVDVFLPVCREPLALLDNTWKNIAAMDYPHVSVYVLDDGANDDVRHLAAAHGFNYVRRANRPEMKKAGNLRHAFARTSGDVLVIFDADFCPRRDFLRETIPYLKNPSVGILQTPQYFRRRDEQTWIEQGAGASQEFFYRMVQTNQDHFHASVCVGSCGVYRRAALEPLGGVVAIEHSEDMYTGFKMTELGYQVKYLPLCLAMGICPDEPRSFFMQQYRWCMGTVALVSEKDFWTSNTSRIHKLCFFNGLLYYLATALFIFLGPSPIVLLVWIKADGVLWYYSGFAVPSIVFSCIVVPLWSKARFGMACYRIKVIQSYAHLYAVKDHFMGTVAPWVPSGGGASRASSKAYISSVWCLVVWNIVSTVLIVGGSVWRMMEYPWYHFVPCIVLALSAFSLSMSTLVY